MSGHYLRRIFFGQRLPTSRAIHERLPKFLALPVFASDAISSSAYAVEEILLVLALVAGGVIHSVGVAAAICLLFAMVALSYRQTVMAYPSGGGAYIVARQNLGAYPGLVAAAALLTDYFAGGCAALTGIEAISNGVPAFRPPESRNAATTLGWMAAVCITLFFGIAVLAQLFHIRPDFSGHQTVVSMLGRAVFGNSVLYYVLQAATASILLLAANTSFADFPRLSSILARDGFAPRQLTNLGDRLVFSNGILLLGFFSAALMLLFKGQTHALIPLYAVGVFISFTLSQAGMVRHWRKERTRRWRLYAGVNAAGAVATGIVFIVVGSVKFLHGAWIILVVIPLLILAFRKVSQHYQRLAAALSVEDYQVPRALRHTVLVLVPGLHRGVMPALVYARSIASECEAVFVEMDPAETARLQEQWARWRPGCQLTILRSPWRSLVEPIIDYIRTVRVERHVDLVTVVIPEFATARWWHKLLHNQSGLMLKLALMGEPGVVVVNLRYHLGE